MASDHPHLGGKLITPSKMSRTLGFPSRLCATRCMYGLSVVTVRAASLPPNRNRTPPCRPKLQKLLWTTCDTPSGDSPTALPLGLQGPGAMASSDDSLHPPSTSVIAARTTNTQARAE